MRDSKRLRPLRANVPVLLFLAAEALLLGLAGYHFALQHEEDRIVRNYLARHGLNGLPRTKETALRVSQTLRDEFNIDATSWRSLSTVRRPFLRHDTAFLLRYREGSCGQGTRVLVNLLICLGFDATRVTLFTQGLHPAHTLASVMIDGHEVFIDSINSADWFNRLLTTRDISCQDFPTQTFTDDLKYRSTFALRYDAEPPNADSSSVAKLGMLRQKFLAYSYEALPLSKLLDRLGLRWRALNLQRPPVWLSALAEKPRLIRSRAFFALALLMLAMAVLVRILGSLVSRSDRPRLTAPA